MSGRHPAGVLLTVSLLLFLGAEDSLAKLMFRTDDVYVRQAELVVVADTVSTSTRGGVPVATIEVHSVLMGSLQTSTIDVRDFRGGEEDMPRFGVGERSLLFLSPSPEVSGVFWCVGAEATKRAYRPRDAAWVLALERIARLVHVRQQPDDEARAAALVALLDSEDVELAAAASNYLNYLVTGQDDEQWIINPPVGSSDWSWQDYFNRNVVAHRKKWQAWWRAKQAGR